MGQVPKKSAMPRIETMEEATAICLHASPGTRRPQNDRAAATKPIRDRTQKMLAAVVAAGAGSEGNSHDRAASQPPVSSPGLNLSQMSAPSAPP